MKFKYMIRGLGIGIMITAVVMGAYNRHAVADARAVVLKEYGIEEGLIAEGTEAAGETEEESSAEETTEQVILRDEEKEAEIYSVLDAAKEAEQQGVTLPNPEAEEQPSAADTTQEPLDTVSSDAESSGQDVLSPEPSASAAVPTDEEQPSGETIDIVIESGDDSGTVARKLQNAGVIENAAEYDAFLMQHGYDKRLSTGTKTISVTDDWQTIADKISRK